MQNWNRRKIEKAINFIRENHVLDVSEEAELRNISHCDLNARLDMVYVHLTDSCNLKCTYCYNKEVRTKGGYQILNLEGWIYILKQVLPIVHTIVFTGGECFLYPYFSEILKYVKENFPKVRVHCLSNGMCDFEASFSIGFFEYIDQIFLSCDSLLSEGERIGFRPEMIVKNVEFVQKRFPKVALGLSMTVTDNNESEIESISNFCKERGIEVKRTPVLPQKTEDIDLMPSLQCRLNECANYRAEASPLRQWSEKRPRCYAGETLISIAANGDVYPCQALHYEPLRIGNLREVPIGNLLRKVRSKPLCPDVNSFPQCKKCDVKYICGGGCPANGYALYGKFEPNHLCCPISYEIAISKLLKYDNRIV